MRDDLAEELLNELRKQNSILSEIQAGQYSVRNLLGEILEHGIQVKTRKGKALKVNVVESVAIDLDGEPIDVNVSNESLTITIDEEVDVNVCNRVWIDDSP